jgi:hypothetical protein
MAGNIRLSLEREPSYFGAAEVEGGEHVTIVATDRGRIICAGGASFRQRYLNGVPSRVGYLGGLRLDHSCRGRASIIRRGYEAFRELQEQSQPSIYFTSIISDNLPARRLLEAGLKGMPTYRLLGEIVTLVLKVRRASRPCEMRGHESNVLTPSSPLARPGRPCHDQNQLAPVWSADDLLSPTRCPNLHVDDFLVIHSSDGSPAASAALWDQRPVKQVVVRGYAPWLSRLRRPINLCAILLEQPRLPSIGQTISSAYISHITADPARPELLESLIRGMGAMAGSRGIDYLLFCVDSRDPRLPRLRKAFRPREFRSRLYMVYWGQGAAPAPALDGRPLAPEVATL